VTAEPIRDDLLDPQRILADLPEDERGVFLAQYRQAVEEARDPASWKDLWRVLRLWRFHAQAIAEPGYWEAREAARGPVTDGIYLEEAVRLYRPAS
jgi:hypothetical protein